MRKILIVDGMNLFSRHYTVNPAINEDGAPFGGVYGVVSSIQKYCREMKPDEIHIAWDGGSDKRKELNENYKSNRESLSPTNLNRFSQNLSEKEIKENRYWQWGHLVEYYLNNMPIQQYWLENVEADDIIAYLAKHKKFEKDVVVIISNDKDFLQLTSNRILFFTPIKKIFYTSKRVKEEYNISVQNFALARSIAGDNSDNLKGVPRAGLKTIAKRLEILKENKEYSIEELIEYCKKQKNKIKLYSDIIEHESLIKDNFKLMQLGETSLTSKEQEEIENILNNFVFEFNQTALTLIATKDGIDLEKWRLLFAHLRGIIDKVKK